MKPFHESLRYDYPLTPDSIVIDAGGYEGNFAKTIAEKYGCRVFVYEPVKRFYDAILARVLVDEKLRQLVSPIHAGLGAHMRRETFGIKGDMTGIVAPTEESEEVQLLDAAAVVNAWLAEFNRHTLSLLKLNVEGCEFEIMEALLDSGTMARIDYVQVQPHNIIPHAEARWEAIRNRMAITHRMTFDAPWCWTGWEIK
jgi:FkbM family methyltransferase